MDFDGLILVQVLTVLFVGTVVIVPIVGITVRFALKPVVESWRALRETPHGEERLREVESRVALLEAHVQELERENVKLLEDADFRAQLRTPP